MHWMESNVGGTHGQQLTLTGGSPQAVTHSTGRMHSWMSHAAEPAVPMPPEPDEAPPVPEDEPLAPLELPPLPALPLAPA
jgi:hypothetical protein